MSRPDIKGIEDRWHAGADDALGIDRRALLDYVEELEAELKARDQYIESVEGLERGELSPQVDVAKAALEILND